MWLAAGLKLADVGIRVFNMVEKSRTTEKDKSKTGMAIDFARDVLGGCSDPSAASAQALLMQDPDVKQAFEKYAEAYVNLQNVMAKKGATNG